MTSQRSGSLSADEPTKSPTGRRCPAEYTTNFFSGLVNYHKLCFEAIASVLHKRRAPGFARQRGGVR